MTWRNDTKATATRPAPPRAPASRPQSWIARLLLAVMLVSVAALDEAQAQTDPRARAVGAAFKGWKVSGFDVKGIEGGLRKDLRKGLQLNGTKKLFRTRRPKYSPVILDDDLERTRLYMARNGYPFATIRPILKPNGEKQKVEVTLVIDPGPLVRVVEVLLEGVPPGLQEKAWKAIAIRDGSRFADDQVKGSAQAVQEFLWQQGYAEAEVEWVFEPREDVDVAVRFTATPGEIYYFSDLDVIGATEDLEPTVRKSISLKPGTRYDPRILRTANDRLRTLRLFRQVNLVTEPTAPDSLKVVCTVSEAKQRSLYLAGGYWTEWKVRVRAIWEDRNLLKRGRGVNVRGDFSFFFQILSATAWQPTLLSSNTRGDITARFANITETSFEQRSIGAEVGLTRFYGLQTTLRFSVAVSHEQVVELIDIPLEDKPAEGLLTVLRLSWTRDTRLGELFPADGHTVQAYTEWAPEGPISDNHYVKGEVRGSLFTPQLNSLILAGRLRLGAAAPLGESTTILPDRRFFAGGANSHRGFNRRKLGPLDPEGNEIGGEVVVDGSVEERIPLIGRLRLGLFVDFGQVWLTPDLINSDIEVALGAGLILLTPVGPVRVDIGHRLTDYEKTQPTTVWHFSIGSIF